MYYFMIIYEFLISQVIDIIIEYKLTCSFTIVYLII